MSGLLVVALVLAAIVVMYRVVRLVNRDTDEPAHEIIRSPVNEALTSDALRVVVGAVLALDDEMLIDLRSAAERNARAAGGSSAPRAPTMWVHSPANVASIITLTRWQDSQTVVEVRRHPRAVVLSNDHARVSLVRARADLVL